MWRLNGSRKFLADQGCDSGLRRSALLLADRRRNGTAWPVCLGSSTVPFRKLWDRNRLLYDRGDLSPEAYWSAVAKDAGTQLTPQQLPLLRQWDVEMWAHDNPVMVKWLRADSFRRNQDRASFQHAARDDPARAPDSSPGWNSLIIRHSRPR